MSRSVNFLILFCVVLFGTILSNAQCTQLNGKFYDDNGRKLTTLQLKKVKADEPLIQAIQESNMVAVEAALEKGVDVNARTCESETTALMLTILNRQPEIMRVLISHKANLNLQNYSGFTALMFAVGMGNVNIVKELIKAGADVNVRRNNKSGVKNTDTALSDALRYSTNNDMKEIANLLRQHGTTK